MLLTRPLFLTGFMGAGKSTIGRLLAARLGCDFIDLDDEIISRTGVSIQKTFDAHGEKHFRRLETEVLMSLSDRGPAVFATGGGLVMSLENREYMHASGLIVYLQAEWETLKLRLADSTGRPLLSGDDDWSRTHDLLKKRLLYYEDADLIVPTDGKSPEQIVTDIRSRIRGIEQ